MGDKAAGGTVHLSETRLSVNKLSKAFFLTRRKIKGGIALGGISALRTLITRMMRGDRSLEESARGRADLFYALDDISFDVRPGEILGIIGRNGAGKSTLLKILARVHEPTAGQAILRGKVISLLELGMGFAPDLTVRENIQIYGRLAGISPKDIEASEESILRLSNLVQFRDVPLEECPSGAFVQLGFSAMINLHADVILADEVLAVGDAVFRKTCEARIREVGQGGGSVLFVSHDLSAIRRICTRVIWIDRGRIRMDGVPDHVVTAYSDEILSGSSQPAPGGEGGCKLLDLRLLSNARTQIGAAQITEAFFIDCLFRVEGPQVAVKVEIELWQGKLHVLTSLTPNYITSQAPKAFRAGARLPDDFLNEQNYRVHCRLLAWTKPGYSGEPVIADELTLEFSVMNPHPEHSVWADWKWGRAGVISPRLNWTRHDGRASI